MLRRRAAVVAIVVGVLSGVGEARAESLNRTDSLEGRWHIKTSLPAWAVAVVNVGGEYQLSDRWSVGLDLAYSAWNYGKVTRKFRTFKFRPEMRFWLCPDGHKGFFVEAHVAMIAYNVALPSWKYRIQDRDGKHPALGGGLGVGYRFRLGRSGRWSGEAAFSFGAYKLDYDRFLNERNGPLVDSKKKTFFGIDNLSLSIVYNFKTDKR